MGMLIVGCTEKKPLTPEEQWHGYCTSVGNAARSILFDRQQAIEKSQAIEHANKIEDEITKNSSLILLKSLRHSTRRIKNESRSLARKD